MLAVGSGHRALCSLRAFLPSHAARSVTGSFAIHPSRHGGSQGGDHAAAVQQRAFAADHQFANCDSVWPVCQLQHALETVQLVTGMPWWLCIVGTTVTLRTVITLPLAANQHRRVARAELLGPTLQQWSEAIAHKVAAECRRENKSHEEANKVAVKEVSAKRGLLWSTHLFSRLPRTW